MNYWLMKSEPSVFSIDNLARSPNQIAGWDGVRNYQARNMLRDDMRVGDLAFFYHSSCKEPGIVGIATICRAAYPDPTAFDPTHRYYDPQSNPDKPRWYQVDVKLIEKLTRPITLTMLKNDPALQAYPDFPLLRRGNRLSIMPVAAALWKTILHLG